MPKNFSLSKINIGTTFSYREAEWLGLNWQETLRAIISLGLKPIRIGAYWSEIEKNPGKYSFPILDKIIEILADKKVPIILEVGLKAPRWPEFYFPDWLEKRINLLPFQPIKNSVIQKPLLNFLEKTIIRYETNKYIRWLNIENEPLNFSGQKQIRIQPNLLKKEIKLARKLSKKPIILNSWVEMHPLKRSARDLAWRENSLPICLQEGDILGLSVYPKYPGQPKIQKEEWQFLAQLFERARGKQKDAWITELQAEPWEKNGQKDFKNPLGNQSCQPKDIKDYLTIAENLGFKTILLWGAEFWYRCLKEKNSSWWNTVKLAINNNN